MTQANQSKMLRRKMAAFDWRKFLEDLSVADALLQIQLSFQWGPAMTQTGDTTCRSSILNARKKHMFGGNEEHYARNCVFCIQKPCREATSHGLATSTSGFEAQLNLANTSVQYL
jgi:hypothetical protein